MTLSIFVFGYQETHLLGTYAEYLPKKGTFGLKNDHHKMLLKSHIL